MIVYFTKISIGTVSQNKFSLRRGDPKNYIILTGHRGFQRHKKNPNPSILSIRNTNQHEHFQIHPCSFQGEKYFRTTHFRERIFVKRKNFRKAHADHLFDVIASKRRKQPLYEVKKQGKKLLLGKKKEKIIRGKSRIILSFLFFYLSLDKIDFPAFRSTSLSSLTRLRKVIIHNLSKNVRRL